MVADRRISERRQDHSPETPSQKGARIVKGGRKPLPAIDRKDSRVTVRFKPDQRAQVELAAKSVGMTPVEFMRARALGFTPKTTRSHDIDLALAELNTLLLELSRIGNNVNQLAKAVHTDTGFQQYWREIGQEVKTLSSSANIVLARLVAK